jgi:hypothetical protein
VVADRDVDRLSADFSERATATRLLAHPATGEPIDVMVHTTFEHDEVVFAATALPRIAAEFVLEATPEEARHDVQRKRDPRAARRPSSSLTSTACLARPGD